MPNYKAHLVGGLGAFGLVAWATQRLSAPWTTLVEWVSFALLGSLFPDVDIRSKGRIVFFRLLIPVIGYCLVQQHYNSVGVLCILALLAILIPHRTLFHSVWFIIIFSLVPAVYAQVYAPTYARIITWDCIFFATGALSHVILDFGPKRLYRKTFK